MSRGKMSLLRAIHAESLKMKRSMLVWIHVGAGVAAGVLCGAYFAVASWNTSYGADAFVQVLGAALPLMVGLVCGLAVEAEQDAGGMANLLQLSSRWIALAAKLLMLVLWGLLALALAVGLFALILLAVGRNHLPVQVWIFAVFGLLLGSLSSYLIALGLALIGGRSLAIGIGALGTLVAVMSVGGVAYGLVAGKLTAGQSSAVMSWVPFTWPTRFASLAIEYGISGQYHLGQEIRRQLGAALYVNLCACSVVTVSFATLLLVWINCFENRRGRSV
ncbi:ABC transporter permease [Bifidobacterium sp. ESL0784]|uniref:ABC transporter permease n=1 Tax=Bifidobacterium sp. ESL0784 TaxID=2983231 RepID=UPI0023F925C5|nr:ABC transporter permease [Bifidobacterium sp. ESL0784]MDF7641110.1 ABC transporter permease [Bifidobacterium sp. ESL0784]